MIGPTPVCLSCKHYHADKSGMGITCDAFPDGEGIPDDILVGGNKHTKPYPGDHSIQYEPLPKAETQPSQ